MARVSSSVYHATPIPVEAFFDDGAILPGPVRIHQITVFNLDGVWRLYIRSCGTTKMLADRLLGRDVKPVLEQMSWASGESDWKASEVALLQGQGLIIRRDDYALIELESHKAEMRKPAKARIRYEME